MFRIPRATIVSETTRLAEIALAKFQAKKNTNESMGNYETRNPSCQRRKPIGATTIDSAGFAGRLVFALGEICSSDASFPEFWIDLPNVPAYKTDPAAVRCLRLADSRMSVGR